MRFFGTETSLSLFAFLLIIYFCRNSESFTKAKLNDEDRH